MENHGLVPPPRSTTRYYLSLDVVKGSTDTLLLRDAARAHPGSGAASSWNCGGRRSRRTTPLGTYVLLACADGAAGTAEGDESNNCKASLGAVRVE